MRTFDINALTALSKYHQGEVVLLAPWGSKNSDPNISLVQSDVLAKYDHPHFIIEQKKIIDEVLELDKLYDFDIIVFNTLLSTEIPKEICSKFVFVCHGNFQEWGRTQQGRRFHRVSRSLRDGGGRAYCVGSEWLIQQYHNYANDRIFTGQFDINCVDPLLVEETPDNRGAFLFVGRASAVKGIKTAIRLKQRGLEIDIYTTIDPHYPEYLSSSELRYCIVDAPRQRVIDALLRAKVLLFPSRYEASGGIVSFEALSAGCKVIYTTPAPQYYLERFDAGNFVSSGKAFNQRLETQAVGELRAFNHNLSLERSKAVKECYSLQNLYNRIINL